MRGPIEIAGTQPLQHVGDGILAEQHAPEDRLLGRRILRWLTADVLTGWRNIHTRMAEVIRDSHGASTSPQVERMFVYCSFESKSDRRHVPPREPRVPLATANARRCWEPYQTTL